MSNEDYARARRVADGPDDQFAQAEAAGVNPYATTPAADYTGHAPAPDVADRLRYYGIPVEVVHRDWDKPVVEREVPQ